MKEFKFRQTLRDHNGHFFKFRYWGLINSDSFVYPVFGSCGDNRHEQYTGLKDSDGVEIYEGDRLNEFDAIVVFARGAFYVDHIYLKGRKKTLLCDWLRSRTIAKTNPHVIGNIHENKELLEAGDE